MSYRTSDIARLVGVHPNTVRLYEDIGFISPPKRLANGYRSYEELHVRQLRFARILLRNEVLQSGLRKKAVVTIKLFAARRFAAARVSLKEYDAMLEREIYSAKSAAHTAEAVLSGEGSRPVGRNLKRTEAASYLNVTVDALRTWEMNGLISVKRMENGYRVYSPSDVDRLRLIKTLRNAGYSQTAILRLLMDTSLDAETALNTPYGNEEIVSACDRLISSLENARKDAAEAALQLK